jgi:bifunctional DNase/RNase
MIQLQFERFDETNHILALKELDGDRFLFIAFGEKEATEIGRSLRLEPAGLDASQARWMEMIEQRGAVLESVAITDLFDGVFNSSVFLIQDGRSFDLPARSADAIAWTFRSAIPVLATTEVMRLASVKMSYQEVEEALAGTGPEAKSETYGDPVAAFRPPTTKPSPAVTSALLVVGWCVTSLLATAMLWMMVAFARNRISAGDYRAVALDLVFHVPHVIVLLGMSVLLLNIRRSDRKGGTILEIYPFGARLLFGKIKAYALWLKLDTVGPTAWYAPGVDGIKSKKRFFGIGGIGLSPFENNWREGEIGGLIRRYRPSLLGIEPVDPEGGRPIF